MVKWRFQSNEIKRSEALREGTREEGRKFCIYTRILNDDIKSKDIFENSGNILSLPTLASPATTIKEVNVNKTPTSSQRQEATWIPWLSWLWLWWPPDVFLWSWWRRKISDMFLNCSSPLSSASSPLATSFLLRLFFGLSLSAHVESRSLLRSWCWIQCQKCLIGWLPALSCGSRSVKDGGCCPSVMVRICSSDGDCIRTNVTGVNDDSSTRRTRTVEKRNRLSMTKRAWSTGLAL